MNILTEIACQSYEVTNLPKDIFHMAVIPVRQSCNTRRCGSLSCVRHLPAGLTAIGVHEPSVKYIFTGKFSTSHEMAGRFPQIFIIRLFITW